MLPHSTRQFYLDSIERAHVVQKSITHENSKSTILWWTSLDSRSAYMKRVRRDVIHRVSKAALLYISIEKCQPERASRACFNSVSRFLMCCCVALTSSVASPPLLNVPLLLAGGCGVVRPPSEPLTAVDISATEKEGKDSDFFTWLTPVLLVLRHLPADRGFPVIYLETSSGYKMYPQLNYGTTRLSLSDWGNWRWEKLRTGNRGIDNLWSSSQKDIFLFSTRSHLGVSFQGDKLTPRLIWV